MKKNFEIGWQSWSYNGWWWKYLIWNKSPFKSNIFRRIKFYSCKLTKWRILYWCSWYAFGGKISHIKIINTVKIIRSYKLPFTHILIDDGWTKWGDWQNPDTIKFPDISKTIKKVNENKLGIGLWMAPFLADKNSLLYRSHPEWFVHHKSKMVKGSITNSIVDFFVSQKYLLNLSLPQVRKHITDFIDLAVKKWGVSLLKLDFLYAIYFDPNLKDDKLPHAHIVWLLSYIKNNYPIVKTIACGVPFAPSVNLADIVRIGFDNAAVPWVPKIVNKIYYEYQINILQEKLKKIGFNFGQVDPDVRVFLLDNNKTSDFWNKYRGQILGVGDDLTALTKDKLIEVERWLTKISHKKLTSIVASPR